MDSAPGGGRRWQREKAGRGSGWGVRNGERKKKKNTKTRDSWRRSPCWRRGLFRPVHRERRGSEGTRSGLPLAARPPPPPPAPDCSPSRSLWATPGAASSLSVRGAAAAAAAPPVAPFGCHRVAKAASLGGCQHT